MIAERALFMAGITNTISVTAYQPDTAYKFCAFAIDYANVQANGNHTHGGCNSFKSSTLPWPIYKSTLTF